MSAADPTDDKAYKLVYTGEDYPYNDHFGDAVAFLGQPQRGDRAAKT